MAKLEKIGVSVVGLLPSFVKLVKEWRPPALKGETTYRDHLVKHIRDSIPTDARVEAEYRHRGTTMDIWVSWKGILQNDELAFELKHDLQRKTDFNRLVGQIEELDPRTNKVLVVLVGDTHQALLGRLREKYGKFLSDSITGNATLAIECVGVTK